MTTAQAPDAAADGVPAPAPEPPPAAAEVFGGHLDVLRRYAQLLAGPGVQRGLLGPREAPRLWERHLLNCIGVAELVQDGSTVLDLGSGAGLPGIVLAAARPQLTLVLVEPLQRRATFLEEAVAALGLRNAVIRRARAEELAGKVLVDVVVARAVAPLDRLAGWALPLLSPGGRLLALKGEQAGPELAAAGAALKRAGAASADLVDVGSAELGTAARVVSVTRGATAAQPRATQRSGMRPGGITATSRRRDHR